MARATAQNVANYLLYLRHNDEPDNRFTKMQIQKLVYYAYGFHYALFNQRLFDETLEAWQHGPVARSLHHAYRDLCDEAGLPTRYLNFSHSDAHLFSTEQQAFLQSIYEQYGGYSAATLRTMTHEEAPWINGYNGFGYIDDDDILKHFSAIISANEEAALLEEYPELLADIEAMRKGTLETIPHEHVMQELAPLALVE